MDTLMNVGQLENLLLGVFPPTNAESWDRVGLSVGNLETPVSRIVCGLDADIKTVRFAIEAGAQVLVTHHPAMLHTPYPILAHATPLDYQLREESGLVSEGTADGAGVVWEAASNDLSLIALHTNLDNSEVTKSFIARTFDMERKKVGPFDYGTILKYEGNLVNLAVRVAKIYDCSPQVWGDGATPQDLIAICTGSLSVDSALDAVRRGAKTIVCGECGYHRLLEITSMAISVIIVGHDKSEQMYAELLAETLRNAGISDSQVILAPAVEKWWTLKKGPSL